VKPSTKTRGSELYCHVRISTAKPNAVIRMPRLFAGRRHQAIRPAVIAVPPIATVGRERRTVWWRSSWRNR